VLAEARAASSLNHPAIITIYEVKEEHGLVFIVMELLRGKTLRSLVAGAPNDPRTLSRIGAQIADGLAAAHARGLIHGDIKPENVVLLEDGRVKILDFGLAHRTMVESATKLDPRFADAWARLAEACLLMVVSFDPKPGWSQRAERAVRRALALDPGNAEAYAARGRLLWSPAKDFKHTLALRALNQALKLNPGCHQAQLWKGTILNHIGLFAEARAEFAAVLAVNPDDAYTLNQLAHMNAYLGNYGESEEYFARALTIDPSHLWANIFSVAPDVFGRPGARGRKDTYCKAGRRGRSVRSCVGIVAMGKTRRKAQSPALCRSGTKGQALLDLHSSRVSPAGSFLRHVGKSGGCCPSDRESEQDRIAELSAL
jgi:serine/threonine protein kinase